MVFGVFGILLAVLDLIDPSFIYISSHFSSFLFELFVLKNRRSSLVVVIGCNVDFVC